MYAFVCVGRRDDGEPQLPQRTVGGGRREVALVAKLERLEPHAVALELDGANGDHGCDGSSARASIGRQQGEKPSSRLTETMTTSGSLLELFGPRHKMLARAERRACYGLASVMATGIGAVRCEARWETYGTIGLVRSMLERSPPTMSSTA